MVLRDSSIAESIKPHVLTTTTSDLSYEDDISYPWVLTLVIIFSVSDPALGQPSEIKPILGIFIDVMPNE